MEHLFRTYFKYPDPNIKLEELKLNNPIAVHAMPGMGMVGKNAIDHILKKLTPKPDIILEIYSTAFPSNVIIGDDGIFNPPKIQFYLYRKEPNDLMIITGDAQPKSILGTNNLSAVLAEQMNLLHVSYILSLAATPVNAPKADPKLYVTVTNDEDLEKLGLKHFVRGAVTGMNGLVVAFAKMEYQIDGCVILSETYPHFLEDLYSSISIIRFLNQFLKLDIPYEELEKKAEETRNFYDSMIRKRKKRKTDKTVEELDYYR